MFKSIVMAGLGMLVMFSAAAYAQDQERCLPGTRCMPSPQPSHFDARYVCRATSYSGHGYPLSYQIGDRYICQDLGYSAFDRRIWPGGNYTGRYVCCFDPYGR